MQTIPQSCESIIEVLFDAYNESSGFDNAAIKADFEELYRLMNGKPLKEIDEIIYMIHENDINKPGHSVPNHPGDEPHRPNHPEKPNPPVGPGHPEPPKKPEKPIIIIVNGVDKVLPAGTKQLSYEEVVKLAYPNYNDAPNILYTVVFSNGPIENKKGTLVKGDIVCIRGEMIFNVGKSNKS